MPTYDYIYGSRVLVLCKKQINMHEWSGDTTYSNYLRIIQKKDDFFDYWCKLRTNVQCIVRQPPIDEQINGEVKEFVGTEIDDELQERNRVVSWSKEDVDEVGVVPRGGHRGQKLTLSTAFCARDQGFQFELPDYTST